jgi:hypothetical protein
MAHENESERSIRAGLDIVETLSTLQLAARCRGQVAQRRPRPGGRAADDAGRDGLAPGDRQFELIARFPSTLRLI